MKKCIMIAQSCAKTGREEEYNQWYDNIHLKEVCGIPGVKSGCRFEALPISVGQPGQQYLAIYEIEADNPTTVVEELNSRFASGKMSISDALDFESASIWLYQPR